MATNFQADEDSKLNLPYVLDRVAWLLRQWPEERRRGFPDPYRQPERYLLAIPTAVNAEIFPLLYECINPNCRRAVSYQNLRQASKINPDLRCPTCGSFLIQLHHVLIHRCGHIRQFIVARCPKHSYDHMWLDTRGSQKYTQFRWRCRRCSFQQQIIYGKCNDCNLDKPMRPIVHRATASYYSQYRILINLPGKDLNRILEDPERHWLAIAAYLRLFSHGPDNRLADLVASPQGLTTEQESIATLERLIQSAPSAMKASLQAKLDELRKELSGIGGDRRSQIIRQAKNLVTLQDQALEEAGRELLELVRLDETSQITTLPQLEQKARREMPGRLPVYRVAYGDALRQTGLAGVRLVGDFPVTTVVIGYTRDQREADNTVIRAFPRLRQDDPRGPLFVDTVETEALMFRLDPARVLRWLALNGLTTGNLPEYQNEAAVRSWLLNRMGSVNPYREIAQEDTITRAVYGLVHSFSHLVLRQAVIQSGFDRTSLSEYLFPRALSFVLYSNNRTKFTIGGLYTLFEQTLHEHLRAVLDKGEACVYDPVCTEETAACHACMHISELSCEHFNRNLSRRYLFGRIEEDGREFIGYWDARCNA
ncbi:hypothetical protein HKBW3S42_00097 [Candidatus Hakubella thermalkaliphila]|uniref:Uncharacterized protein n=1 Tax=Candidatus Hakubella thermalkaliphila TaxID=2754717 RepID=A0A6V8PLS3_9ACTN|nr:hypothetical protein HKBW3S42_00097 [Candidatus Hakubella thermalkaliphila]GFP41379.1 hypothetical protein HKBW3C_00505 [Candidatus Hakubella thermalkaliphila]